MLNIIITTFKIIKTTTKKCLYSKAQTSNHGNKQELILPCYKSRKTSSTTLKKTASTETYDIYRKCTGWSLKKLVTEDNIKKQVEDIAKLLKIKQIHSTEGSTKLLGSTTARHAVVKICCLQGILTEFSIDSNNKYSIFLPLLGMTGRFKKIKRS